MPAIVPADSCCAGLGEGEDDWAATAVDAVVELLEDLEVVVCNVVAENVCSEGLAEVARWVEAFCVVV